MALTEQNLMRGRSRRIGSFFLIWISLYLAGAGFGAIWAGRIYRLLGSCLTSFCGSLSVEGISYLSCLLPAALAVVLIFLMLLLPAGRILIWPFLFCKAFGSSFVLSLFYLSADSEVRFPAICGILLHSALLLPVFYFLYRDAQRRGSGFAGPGVRRILPVFLYLALAALLEYLFLRHAFVSPM